MELSKATWPEVDAVADRTDLAVLPVGSTEQHGPHAPLGTDSLTAGAVAEAGVDRYEGQAALAPTVPVGVAAEHRAFSGTLWVSPDTFRSYVRETVASLAHHGFDRVVLVNGHGGNVDALREVAAGLTRGDVARTVPFTWFEHVDGEMGHGGSVETAAVRQIAPDLVREDRLAEAAEGGADRWGEYVEGVNVACDTDEFSENGVVGDPRAGDAETGEAYLQTASASLARLLAALTER
jgi:creatinine amidohydrolase